HGDQRAARNLKRQRRPAQAVVAAGARVQVHWVVADAHTVRERLRPYFALGFARCFHPQLSADVLLQDREFRLDAARLANVRVHGQAVFRADRVFTESETSPTRLAVWARGVGLQPVQQRQAQLLAPCQVLFGLILANRVQTAQVVVVLWPVD